MNKKGYSFVEMLISVAILTVVLLSLADFSFNTLDVTNKHSLQLENTISSRSAAEQIFDKVSKSAYIYPKGIDFTLNIDNVGGGATQEVTVSTNDSLALLIPIVDQESLGLSEGEIAYDLVVFYLVDQDNGTANLYEFTTNWYHVIWTDSIGNPADEITTDASGTITLLAENIDLDNVSLSYIMNYDNGITDTQLFGEVGNRTPDDIDALINGVSWDLTMKGATDSTLSIKGISRNVPRSI